MVRFFDLKTTFVAKHTSRVNFVSSGVVAIKPPSRDSTKFF